MSDDPPKNKKTGRERQQCSRCGGSGTENYTVDEPMGGGTRETMPVTRTRSCSACGGSGYF